MGSHDGRFEADIADALTRVAALSMADSKVEKLAGLPSAFLNKARAGKNRGERSAPSWAKLRGWLALQPSVGKGLAPCRPDGPTSAVNVPGTGEQARQNSEQSPLSPANIAEAIRLADSAQQLDDVLRLVGQASALGVMNRTVGKLLADVSAERRKTLDLRSRERALATLTTRARHLTPQEAEWLAERRAARATRPLAPDEAAPPPPLSGPS